MFLKSRRWSFVAPFGHFLRRKSPEKCVLGQAVGGCMGPMGCEHACFFWSFLLTVLKIPTAGQLPSIPGIPGGINPGRNHLACACPAYISVVIGNEKYLVRWEMYLRLFHVQWYGWEWITLKSSLSRSTRKSNAGFDSKAKPKPYHLWKPSIYIALSKYIDHV